MEEPTPTLPESTCRNCGSVVALEPKGEIVIKREVDGDFRHGGPRYETIVSISVCRFCEQPTVWTYVWGRDTYEQFANQRLYPPPRDDSALPPRARARLDEALRVKRINPDLYAVAIGRVLETICSEEGVTGRDLAAKLRELAIARAIPGPLLDIADELRRLRNLGAHDAEVTVAHEDVELIESLAESLLEYLYRGPARLAAIREALDEREVDLRRRAAERRVERKERWTREELLTQIEERRGAAEADVARRLFAWVDARGDLTEFYGKGKKDGSFQAGYQDTARYLFPFALYGYGRVEIHFQYIQRQPSFSDEQSRRELLGRLNMIPGVSIGDDMLSKRPSISLQVLTDQAAFERLTATLDWAFQRASDSSR
ncbi:MAG: DUF4145 domain-containing protein [Thermoleophilaceae bacterium]